MGKIFGISDNPVSTIERALQGYNHVEPPFVQAARGTKDAPIDKFVGASKKVISKPKNGVHKFVRKMLSYFKK